MTGHDGEQATRIVNKRTGRCITAEFKDATGGDNVFTAPCSGPNIRELWQQRSVVGS